MSKQSLEMLDIDLSSEDARDPSLLVPYEKRTLGGGADIQFRKIRIRIGRRPLAFNLLSLYKQTGRDVPSEFKVFSCYDIWILMHVISILDQGGLQAVRQIEYEIAFKNDFEATVLEVLPHTRFIKQIGADFESIASIDLSGQASIPEILAETIKDTLNLSFGVKFELINRVNILGRLSLSVMTPVVQAVGIGDNTSKWILKKHHKPLLGDQVMVQIVLVPRHTRKLVYEVKMYATIASPFNLLPVRFPKTEQAGKKFICNLIN